MNTTFRPRPIPSRPEELAMSLVCRWGGVSVEMGLGERIPASLWDASAKDLFRKNLTQEERGGLCELLELGAEVTAHPLAALTRHPGRNEQKSRIAERRCNPC